MLANSTLTRIFGHIVRNILIVVAFFVIVPIMLNVHSTAIVVLGLFIGIALVIVLIKSLHGSIMAFKEMGKSPYGEYE